MSTSPFVHLHCHSHYSLLDGASPIDRLVSRTVELGMNALAITDHGNLHGALEFYQAAKAAGINPIIGYEAYIAPGSRFQKDAGSQKESSFHLTLLARDRTGFANLLQLATKAYLEGFYFKPRIDRELLEEFGEGIICLSGCLSGEFSRALVGSSREQRESLAQAREIAGWFQRTFGDRYFIEIQDNGLDVQRQVTDAALEIARELGIPPVATCDCHYVNREDAEAQDILLCVNTGRFRNDATRMRMDSSEFYLKSPTEMHAAFAGHDRGLVADAVTRSQTIADSVGLDLDLGKRHFPGFDVPGGRTASAELRRLCLEGLRERYATIAKRWAGGTVPADPATAELHPQVLERLDRELAVIDTLGFASYFLIVWDFVRHAREQGIPAAARGSGVGALVAYSLYLSHVCPLEYDLLFERFLDVNRREAPDIDIDFCKERRGEVIEYVKRKYGAANVAQIGTFGTLAARAAIRDVGRAMGLPVPRVDQIVALVPDQLGISLEDAAAPGSQLAAACEADAEVRELVDLAGRIEGLARNVGTHAAAVVIADRPLVEYVPLQRVTGKEEVITQWAMGDVERAGLMKMDFLGLRYLTVVAKTLDIIESTTGQRPDPFAFPLDDAATFALLCRGETKGIFQLESGGIRDLLQRMKPDHFLDIVAVNALYRPGPLEGGMVDEYVDVKHGRKRAEFLHPVMKDVLAETHGVMVYQEQVMRILERLGGIELSSAYTCIKAISKKKLETIAAFREQFVKGAQAQGLTKQQADEVFALIEKFAGYGFNKSHSTAYALLAWQTAYLKTHHPREFMAALLSGDITGRNFKKKDALVEHVEDCRRMGIEVAPPDVNASLPDFSVSGGRILFGLAAIKGCGVQAAEAIAADRAKHGPYRDLHDFCGRLDPSVVNKTAIENLAKAGALDQLGGHRGAILAGIERAMAAGAARLADRKSGQKNLFAAFDPPAAGPATAEPSVLPDVPPLSDLEMRSGEKEVLGYYVHSHPLAEHKDLLDSLCSHGTAGLGGVKAKGEVVIGGLVSALKLSNTKQARPGSTHTRYAMFDLEDMDGLVRTICWPEDYARLGEAIQPDAVILVAGSIDRRAGSEETNLVVNEIVPIAEARRLPARSVTVRMVEGTHDAAVLDRLAELVGRHPGTVPLRLVIDLADGSRVLLEADRHQVAWSPELHAAVAELLGPGSVRAAVAIGGRGRRDGPGGSRGDGPRRGQGRAPAGVA
ncbi:MAG: DNA polymerase III subunit alpha [Planctomycetaceae bacterium]|nr:DNA polymerase III subunit alpha [Planctomycetaceae bacterium]